MSNEEMKLVQEQAMDEIVELGQELQAQDAVLEEVVDSNEEAKVLELEDLQKQHNPEDVAAAFFRKEESIFPSLVKNLSLNEAHRVILNVAFGGLSAKDYKLISESERRTAYRFNEIVTQRFIMQMAAEMVKVEEAQKKELESENQAQEVQENQTQEVTQTP